MEQTTLKVPRIVVLAHASPRYSKGGGEIAAERESNVLRRLGVQCLLAGALIRPNFVATPSIEMINADEAIFQIADYDDRTETWRDLKGLSAFLDLIENYQPDVIHFHHYWHVGLNTIIQLRKRLPNTRFVMTFHEMLAICINHGQMVRTNGGLCHRYDRLACHGCFGDRSVQEIERRRRAYLAVLNLIDFYIYPSEFIRIRYEDWGLLSAKGRVLENILDADVASIRRQTTGGDYDENTPRKFGFFGQATQFKGLDVFIKAAALAHKRSSDFVVHIHGVTQKRFEELFPQLSNLVASLDTVVLFLGKYEASDVYQLMKNCDWIVVPSIWWENSPVVIQEARAAGVPLIVSGIGGMAEKVRSGVDGLHFHAGNYVDLADKLHRIATRGRAQDISRTITPPITENEFLAGLEEAFAIPLKANFDAL